MIYKYVNGKSDEGWKRARVSSNGSVKLPSERANETLQIQIESFPVGSRTRTTKTDAYGSFILEISGEPTRTISVPLIDLTAAPDVSYRCFSAFDLDTVSSVELQIFLYLMLSSSFY